MISSNETRTKIIVLMACHNRSPITQNYFERFLSCDSNGFNFEFIIVDDGSADETYKVLESQPLPIKIIRGDGTLYWAKSMAVAEEAIDYIPDGILWMNDDLMLLPNAFTILMKAMIDRPNSVLVGQVKDVNSSNVIYGGYISNGINPLNLKLVRCVEEYKKATTFNGNFVYVPAEIRISVGSIDGGYQHAYADCDYGYRVTRSGYSIWVIPEIVGESIPNNPSWSKSRLKNFKLLHGVKRNPIKSQLKFFTRYTSRIRFYLIPLFLLTPYLRILVYNSIKR